MLNFAPAVDDSSTKAGETRDGQISAYKTYIENEQRELVDVVVGWGLAGILGIFTRETTDTRGITARPIVWRAVDESSGDLFKQLYQVPEPFQTKRGTKTYIRPADPLETERAVLIPVLEAIQQNIFLCPEQSQLFWYRIA